MVEDETSHGTQIDTVEGKSKLHTLRCRADSCMRTHVVQMGAEAMMCAGKRQICAALNDDARSRQPCRRGHMIKKVPSIIIKLKFLNDVVLSKDSLLSINIIHSEALKWFKTRRVEHPQ